MNRRVALCVLTIGLVIAEMSAIAANWFTAKIDRINIAPSTGDIHVYFSAGVIHECGSNHLMFYDPSAPGAKMIFAALLAYEAQKEDVQFLVTSCSGTTGIFSNIESQPGI